MCVRVCVGITRYMRHSPSNKCQSSPPPLKDTRGVGGYLSEQTNLSAEKSQGFLNCGE